MNKIIAEQLRKVTATELSFDENTKSIFIPRTLKITGASLKKGHIYRVKFEDFIVNPNQSSTLASNWNAGKVPKHNEYFAEVIDKLGNMIKFNGVAVEDQTDNFYGWIPDEGFEVINEE